MKPYRLLEEHPDHMVVHVDGEERPLKIAINTRHHGTVERIRKFAKGGEVPSELALDPSLEAQPGPNDPGIMDALGAIAERYNPNPNTAPRTPEATPGPPEGIARPEGALPDGTPPPVIPSAAVAPQGQIAPTQGLGGMPNAAGQIAGAAKQGAQAIQAEGQAKAEGFGAIARTEEQAAQHMEEMRVQGEQTLAQRLQRQEQIFNDIQNQKIDPNRYWGNKSTGQKIGASIGLILGGIGAGLTHGPNYALQVIDKSIDRDMESQKLELGKKENLLGQYMQQTRDIVAAQHMAKADYLNGVAAQVQAATARMSGSMAIPAAQAAIAELKAKAVIEEQSAISRTQQIQMGNISLQSSQFQMKAMQDLLAGGSSGGGSKVDPRVFTFLPKELQEKLVPLADGTYATARSKEDAAIVNKTQESTATLRSKLQRYSALLAQHPQGISQIASPNDYQAAQAMRESMLTDLNSLAGLNRFTHEEAQLFGQRVPDITGKQISKGFQAKLKELGKEIDDKVWETNQTYLNIPRARKPGG